MPSKQALLETLRQSMLKADLPLKKTAHHLVFGEVNAQAKVVFVGEAPGKNEDLQGKPFIGSAGKILDEMLASIKLERQDIYITSILKYRPPNNRNPQMSEIIAHTPFLVDQFRIIKPKVIVPLGNFAARFILSGFDVKNMQKVAAISTMHGKLQTISFEGQCFDVIAVHHPAAVLYNRSLHAVLKKDFKTIGKVLGL